MLKLIISSLIITTIICSEGLKVDPNNLHLIDPQGRTRLYHGVNVVYKPYPYYPEYDGTWNMDDSFNEQDVKYLREWGFNQIRLYIAWEGVEPEESKYNMDYINNIKNIVSLCEKGGISVLLDFHQDVYTNYFCGEGLPSWAVESVLPLKDQDFPKPLNFTLERDERGFPKLEDCLQTDFFNYYYSYDSNTLSQDLLTNVNNLADKMGQFWQFVALQFRDSPNVQGYEIINEPWGINIYENSLEELLPYNQQNKFLMPFYQKINEYIRAVDKKTLLFFEPITWDVMDFGFKTNVGGPAYQQLEVLSYHVYCPNVNEQGEPKNLATCILWDNLQSNGRLKNMEKIGVAGFITEFGALGNTEKAAEELDRVLGNADKVLNSWSYWQYKFFNDFTTAATDPDVEGFWDSDGNLQSIKVAALSRAYAQKTCGNLLSQSWNRKKQIFEIQVQINREQCAEKYQTELYLTEVFHYKNGFNTEFTGCDSCKLENLGEKSYYKVIGDEQLMDKTIWTLKVTPK